MKQLNVLTEKKQKKETKALYESVFPEDKGDFLEWYYEDRCKDNIVIDIKVDEKVIAMAHLNPFTICRKGETYTDVFYIYAVATDVEMRHRGYMTEVLNKGFEIMHQKGIPFCFLIPTNKDIYEPFGFYSVAEFTPERIKDYESVKTEYDIYIKEDDDYRRRAGMEDVLCDENSSIPEDAVIMAKIISKESFLRFSGLKYNTTESEMIKWLRSQRIYISESV